MKAAFIIVLLAFATTISAQAVATGTTAPAGSSWATTYGVAAATVTGLTNPSTAVTTTTTSSVNTLWLATYVCPPSGGNAVTQYGYASYQVVVSYTIPCSYYPLVISGATNTTTTQNLLYACQTSITSTYPYTPPTSATAPAFAALTSSNFVAPTASTGVNPVAGAVTIVYATTSVSFQYITWTNATSTQLAASPPVNVSTASYQIFNCTASTSVAPAATASAGCTANTTLTYVQTNTTTAIACFSSYVLATGGVVGSGVNTTMCYANLTSTYAGNTSAQVFAGINQIVNQTSIQITTQTPMVNASGVLASSTLQTTTYTTTNTSCSNIAVSSSCVAAVNTTGNQTVYQYCLPVVALVNGTNQTFSSCYANTTICSEMIASTGTVYTALSCGATSMTLVNTTAPTTTNTTTTTKSASNILVAIQCTLLMMIAMNL